MKPETLEKATFITENIRQLDYNIQQWKERIVCNIVEGSILARINLDENFAVFRDGIIFKMEKHKQMLEEELAKL